MVERCVCCGEMIPEGRMVCPMCEKRSSERRKAMCNHERLRTVGNRVFCCECQEELTLDFLMGNNGENHANNPAPEEEKKKPTSRKRTAKKTV